MSNAAELAELADDWDMPMLATTVPKPPPPRRPRQTIRDWNADADDDPQDEDDMPLRTAVPAPCTPRAGPKPTKASPTPADYKEWSTIQCASTWAGFKEKDLELFLSLLSVLRSLAPELYPRFHFV